MSRMETTTIETADPAAIYEYYHADWNEFAADVLGVTLDTDQRQILSAIQHEPRVSVRSGHARGKDFIAAVAAECFLNLEAPCKVICTAPTDRQVVNIMMAELAGLHLNARVPLGGRPLTNAIRYDGEPNWFLLAFKAADTDNTAWTGFHGERVMVIVTEADGLDDSTYESIEGLMTGGGAKQVLMFNPNEATGYTYKSTKSPDFHAFRLNCLNAPNVVAKKIVYPGQVDYEWVAMQVKNHASELTPDLYVPENLDFEWEGHYYRPDDFFRVRVLGEYPRESESVLIPDSWIDAAFERWREWFNAGEQHNGDPLVIGADVAGMGRDNTVFAYRRSNIVERLERFQNQDHMVTAGKIKHALETEDVRYKEQCDKSRHFYEAAMAPIDTIGEGAGVYARLKEQGCNVVSAKGSYTDDELTDVTGEWRFANLRAYLWWAVRDALDPKLGMGLALPPVKELKEDLSSVHWWTDSSGKVQIEKREDLNKALGRSRDFGDAVRFTFWPKPRRPRARLI